MEWCAWLDRVERSSRKLLELDRHVGRAGVADVLGG